MVLSWCFRCDSVAGASVVPPWFLHGSLEVCSWSSLGDFVVGSWCLRGGSMRIPWRFCGAPVVGTWGF